MMSYDFWMLSPSQQPPYQNMIESPQGLDQGLPAHPPKSSEGDWHGPNGFRPPCPAFGDVSLTPLTPATGGPHRSPDPWTSPGIVVPPSHRSPPLALARTERAVPGGPRPRPNGPAAPRRRCSGPRSPGRRKHLRGDRRDKSGQRSWVEGISQEEATSECSS